MSVFLQNDYKKFTARGLQVVLHVVRQLWAAFLDPSLRWHVCRMVCLRPRPVAQPSRFFVLMMALAVFRALLERLWEAKRDRWTRYVVIVV